MPDIPARLAEALSDRYRLERPLGTGGVATVYLAEDLKHRRRVAVKVLDPGLAATLGPERFLREIEIAGRLSHPHILPVLDSGVMGGFFYYVMPFAEDESLRDRLRREIQLPVDEALRIAGEIADALAYAHAHGIVHRDVKPENVLLQGGHAVVADFGIARAVDEAGGPALTRTGLMIGTPAYMSPEQVTGSHRADARSDLYALGCVLYEMLAGQAPFVAPTAEALVHQQLSVEAPRVTQLRPTVPQPVAEIVRRLLAKAPADRFPDAAELQRALRAAARELGAAPVASAVRPRRLAGVTALRIAVAAAVLIAASVTTWWVMRVPHGRHIDSIAVLPLENLSGDPNQEYFADGMTEELIDRLARVGSIRVVSRTSSMAFKNVHRPLPEIASRLGVDALVEGSVARTGDRVRILAELVQAHPERSLWGDRYERDLRDVLALQAEVAGAIAGRVSAAITPGDSVRLRETRVVNPAAHEEYLRGRYALNRFDTNSFEAALQHFEKAVAIDSNDAANWAGLAVAYYMLSDQRLTPDEAMPRVREAAQHAIRLDPDHAEAHTSLGTVLAQYEWSWDAAEKEYRRAIVLSASSASAHLQYSMLLEECGRADESIREGERAHELDPLSSVVSAYCAWAYYDAGRFGEALDRYRHMLAEDSTDRVARYGVGLCLVELGNSEGAIRELQRAAAGAENGYPLAQLGYAYARAGRVSEAREVLARLSHPADGLYVSPLWLAYVHSALGERDRAFECIDHSFARHDEDLGWLKVDPRLRDLRGDPRFEAALRRLNLHA